MTTQNITLRTLLRSIILTLSLNMGCGVLCIITIYHSNRTVTRVRELLDAHELDKAVVFQRIDRLETHELVRQQQREKEAKHDTVNKR